MPLRKAILWFRLVAVGRAFFLSSSRCRRFHCEGSIFESASTLAATSNLLGGDFAGLSANFALDGTIIPVPEHLVPKDLLEWGDHPTCLEILVSEEEVSSTAWSRQTISRKNSGVDNLDTEKKDFLLELQSLRASNELVSYDVEHEGDAKGRRAETIFKVSVGENHRLRLILDISSSAETGFVIKSPITVALERKVSDISSGGTIADGGGLTGSRVSELLGPHLKVSTPFCNEKPLDWQPPGVKILNLPGNLTIATSEDSKESPWMLDIVHFNINEKGEAEQQVVRRSYHFDDKDS